MRDNIEKPNWLTRFAGNYFSKNVFPYWCVVLADTAIVFVSTAFVYWAFHRTGAMFEHRFALLYLMLLYSVLSIIGARVFRTYAGVVRYSGFVQLLKKLPTISLSVYPISINIPPITTDYRIKLSNF